MTFPSFRDGGKAPPWKEEQGREVFHTLFTTPMQGLGLTSGSAL
jgi:hypothetical protein